MPADEPLRGGVHGGGVERPRARARRGSLERQVGAAVDDAVEIVPLRRREARVEIVGDTLGRQHRDRMRAQMGVERVAHGVAVPVLGEVDMRDLAERVHAGIGAAGAADGDALAAKGGDGVGQTPCTDGPLSCTCQPTKGVPSYSMVSL